MNRSDPDTLLDFVTRTAERAGEITRSHFGITAVEFKSDGSEVTEADRAAERFIRSAIGEAFPADAVLGEEEGASARSSNGRRWIVDPIDGTRSFAAGVPLYGVLLALEQDNHPILACCHFPELGQTLVAASGAGAWFNGRRAEVSACDRIEEARVVTSGLEYWRDWATECGHRGWTELIRRSRFARTWGDCYGYVLVATGRAEVLADPASGARWDYAPMVPLLTEAGARYTTFGGAPVRAWSTALATNGRLHDAARSCWGPTPVADAELQTEAVLVRARSA